MANTVELVFGADQARTTSQVIQDLQVIAKNVEASGATKLKFSIDTASTSAASKQINTLGNSIKLVSQNNIAGVTTSFNKLQASIAKTSASGETLNALNAAFQKLSTAKIAFDKAPTAVNLDSYRAQKTILNGLLDSFNLNQKAIHATENELLQYKNVLKQVEAEYNRYKDNIQKNPELDSNYQSVIGKLKNGISSGNFDFKDVTDARSQAASLSNTLTETGGKVETFTQKLKNLFGIHLSTALTMVGIHALVQGLNQVYDNVVKLDEAVVNLQVATGYSREQTQALIGDYSNYAKELGATTTQVAEAGNDWLNSIGQVKSL